MNDHLTDDERIARIVLAFREYALGDILCAIKTGKPIAAFILCSCFIDQMTAYRFNPTRRENREKYIEFIRLYLPEYVPLDLYDRLRCKLVHNYTVDEHLSLATDEFLTDTDTKNINVNSITAKKLYTDLSRAFADLKKDMENEGEARINALLRFKDAPTLIENERNITAYDKPDKADYIIAYYSPLTVGKQINKNPTYTIDRLEKRMYHNNTTTLVAVIREAGNNKRYYLTLDEVISQLKLPSQLSVIQEIG